MINKLYNLSKKKIFYMNRSITGKGTLKTLKTFQKFEPLLKIKNYQCNKKVYDWKIPPEWNVKQAYILDKFNNKILNFKNNNLHLIGYSIPIKKRIKKKKLLEHIHFLKEKPNAIPYITSYYKKYWGFCTTFKHYEHIKKKYNDSDDFYVYIDSSFKKNGKLHYGEILIPGKSKKEILLSTYICHPSMANNELSGPIVNLSLANFFKKKKMNYTLRFIFIPETIGSISYIYHNEQVLKKNIIGGYNISCVGDERCYSYMPSRYINTLSEKSIENIFKKKKIKAKRYSFLKRGSDERQFTWPGINLPIASIFRSKYHEYKEYHTSLDTFDNVVTLKGLKGSYNIIKLIIIDLQSKLIPIAKTKCEPFLTKVNMYPTISKINSVNVKTHDLLNFLTYADGKNDIFEISRLINVNYSTAKKILKKASQLNLVY